MSALSKDMLDMIETLNQHGVEYLIVGGHAVNAYTEPRATKDLDIWVNTSEENAKKVIRALQAFGAPTSSMSEKDFMDPESFFIIGVKPNRIDILQKVPGLVFSDAWKGRKIFSISGTEANYLSCRDLITAKLAAGRAQDLVDAKKLSSVIESH